MLKNLAVSNDPCYSDYESQDESDYGSSNSEIYTEVFTIILHLFSLQVMVHCKL